jgi:hypothetical protein
MLGASLPQVSLNSQVRLHPLSRQRENGVVILGRGDQFLELPAEGLDFLAWLDQGDSLAQARARFEARHNPFPDQEVLELVHAFLECDFVAAVDGQPIPAQHAPLKSNSAWLPRRWAQALFSTPLLVAWMAVVIPAAGLWVLTPELWPRRADYFWADYNSLVILTAMLVWLLGMLLHETAHWLACRAKGIEATITWTRRIGIFPMSQTVMHTIWAVPRAARLLPLAAGMAWDVLLLSLAVYLLFFAKLGWLGLPWVAVKLLKFYVLFVCMALAAQVWLFAKMDGYFLVSAVLGQRNLQADTHAWLKSRLLKRGRFEPPAAGMRFIYLYALITVVWGGLFMAQFLLVNLPIKVQLIWQAAQQVWPGGAGPAAQVADGLAVLASQAIYYGLLAYVYVREKRR